MASNLTAQTPNSNKTNTQDSTLLESNLTFEIPVLLNPYMQDSTFLFNCKMSYKDQNISGYLGLKYTDATNFRFSVTTGMGNTMIELEWKDGEFIKHYIPADLDRKIIIKKLKADFEFLFLYGYANGHWTNNAEIKKKRHGYLTYFNDFELPISITDSGCSGKKKRSLSFGYDEKNQLATVELKHFNFASTIQLSILE